MNCRRRSIFGSSQPIKTTPVETDALCTDLCRHRLSAVDRPTDRPLSLRNYLPRQLAAYDQTIPAGERAEWSSIWRNAPSFNSSTVHQGSNAWLDHARDRSMRRPGRHRGCLSADVVHFCDDEWWTFSCNISCPVRLRGCSKLFWPDVVKQCQSSVL